MKILLVVVGFLLLSFWLVILISAGVSSGLRNYFKNDFQIKEKRKWKYLSLQELSLMPITFAQFRESNF